LLNFVTSDFTIHRIAVITDGKVREIGGHDELMAIPDGHYKRLHMFQDLETAQAMKDKMKHLESSVNNEILQESLKKSETTQAAFGQNEAVGKEKYVDKKNAKRAWEMAKPDRSYFFIGAVGAVLAGLVFPGWGVSSMWLHHTFCVCTQSSRTSRKHFLGLSSLYSLTW
jgi:ATP-binding cassette, subfamily B (MDR/TAP), member 1